MDNKNLDGSNGASFTLVMSRTLVPASLGCDDDSFVSKLNIHAESELQGEKKS